MVLVVGLGNPGEKYARTRHNAGFIALDHLFPDVVWKSEKKFKGVLAKVHDSHRQEVLLLKPTTFMNLSGESVCPVLKYFHLRTRQMIVLHDEIDLPLGEVALKVGGGHRGHNGLRDIIRCADANFTRIRIGVGRPEKPSLSVADYVLSPFAPEESLPFQKVREAFEEAMRIARHESEK